MLLGALMEIPVSLSLKVKKVNMIVKGFATLTNHKVLFHDYILMFVYLLVR